MQLQQEISEDKLEQKVGKKLEVIVDEIEGDMIIARSYADAPEIDGTVQAFNDQQVQVGDIITVEIEEATEYDLIGTRV